MPTLISTNIKILAPIIRIESQAQAKIGSNKLINMRLILWYATGLIIRQ